MSEGRSPFDQKAADATPGNAIREAKRVVYKWMDVFTSRGAGFGEAVGCRVKLTEISVNQMPNEPGRLEGKVVAEITITEGLCKLSRWKWKC
jgi:acyl-coenzyme A thioesterase 13